MDQRQNVAMAIALQTHVLRTCPEHDRVLYDEETDPASAFALAMNLKLADLLRETIAAAPVECPQCAAPATGRPI